MNVIITLLYSFALVSSLLYMWYKLLNKKVDFKNYRLYITLISLIFISIFNFFNTSQFMKICMITIFFMFFFKYLFKEKIHKCIITPIFTQILTFIAELIYSLALMMISNDNSGAILNTAFGTFFTNVIIAVILVIFIQFKFVKKLYTKMLNITDKINYIHLSSFCIMAMIILNVLLAQIYYKIEFKYFFIFNMGMIIICFIIIFYSFKTQNKYNKVSDKYNIAIKSLNDYEDMMTKYRVTNHENKNLLLTVRAMVLNKDKDIPKYIDSIIEQRYMDDEKLLFEMSVIPSGGLRATIYSEILKIKENKINYSLNIDRKINTVDLINLETDTIVEICKIIGVFIDNSIEAVKTLRKKNIDIQLYIEDKNLFIKVSNNYKGSIDISKINDEGYTTKGKGHGYGLSLVKNIVNNNDLFENKTEISKTIFSQILIIKYKKTH